MTLQVEIENNPVAKVIIYELIERKKKVTKFETARNRTGIVLGLLLACLFIFGVDFAEVGMFGMPFEMTSFGMLIILCSAAMIMRLIYFQKKVDKAEGEFEELREELIERSEELWKQDEQWNKRKMVFQQILSDHDINLYYR